MARLTKDSFSVYSADPLSPSYPIFTFSTSRLLWLNHIMIPYANKISPLTHQSGDITFSQ